MTSSNAMKMQMNPPSASARQVTGPLNPARQAQRDQILEAARAAYSQSRAAAIRDDKKMSDELHDRAEALMGSLK